MPKPAPAASRIHPVVDQERLLGMLGYNLKRASLRLAREYRKPMQQLGLRPAEFATLVLLLDNPGASQKSLARALAIGAPNMVMLLDRLERRKLVQRVRHPKDERARQLTLTATGRDIAQRGAATVDRHERRAISILTPAERTEFMRLLHKLAAGEI
jgi:DNA-binding MarR family transcriptional regulator